MTWSRAELEAWLRMVEPIANERTPFEWLEIPPTASGTAIQEAYHAIARTRHPDLFRQQLDVPGLDRLVRMYARVTAAYAELRVPEKCAAYLRTQRIPKLSAPVTSDAPAPEPSQAMNPKALTSYRRAEGALRTGDHTAAMLHLKMAIASDPRSTFLRAALTELAAHKK